MQQKPSEKILYLFVMKFGQQRYPAWEWK